MTIHARDRTDPDEAKRRAEAAIAAARAGFCPIDDCDDIDPKWPCGWYILPMALIGMLFWIGIAALIWRIFTAAIGD